MQSTRANEQTNAGPARRAGKRAARGWIAALALLGLGAGALATAAPDAGSPGGSRHALVIAELDRHHCAQCRTNHPSATGARMRPDPHRSVNGVDAGDEGREGADVVPVPGMNVLFPLRAEHYARLCKPRGRLCDLIAAHLRM